MPSWIKLSQSMVIRGPSLKSQSVEGGRLSKRKAKERGSSKVVAVSEVSTVKKCAQLTDREREIESSHLIASLSLRLTMPANLLHVSSQQA